MGKNASVRVGWDLNPRSAPYCIPVERTNTISPTHPGYYLGKLGKRFKKKLKTQDGCRRYVIF